MNNTSLLLFFATNIIILTTCTTVAFAESYWGNLQVDIEKSDRIEGEKSDVIIVRAEFTNNDKEQIIIYPMYTNLDDSQNRQYSTSEYYDLRAKGYKITELDCPLQFSIDLNPGISEDGSFCFEVPKENLEFILHFYESSIDWCKNPSFGSCNEKTVRLVVQSPSSTPSASNKITKTNPVVTEVNTIPSASSPPQLTSNKITIPTSGNTKEIILSGGIFNHKKGIPAEITLTNPDGVTQNFNAGLSDNGNYRASFSINEKSLPGVYKIQVSHNGTYIGSTSFTVSPKTIPELVKNNPPKILKPTDIMVSAENQLGAKVTYDILAIDDIDEIVNPSCNKNSGSTFPIGKSTVTCNAVDSSGNKATPVTFTVTVNSTTAEIPNWVKSIASFWCKDSIDDASFIEGIQYLINSNVIIVSSISNSGNNQGIPQWVKNNACWWSEGSINDKDFSSGIEYLIKNGILTVNSVKTDTSNINDETSDVAKPENRDSTKIESRTDQPKIKQPTQLDKITGTKKQLPTEDKIVAQISDEINRYSFTSLKNRTVDYENGENTIKYTLFNDDNEFVGVLILAETESGISKVSVGAPYKLDGDSFSKALWLLSNAQHGLIPIEKWKEATGHVFMPWVIETLKDGKNENKITVDGKNIFFFNNIENPLQPTMMFIIVYG